jgi:hypothetical protein
MKTDPATGSAEAIGRLFNALFLTYELKQKEQEVAHIFQGAGTRWAAEVVRPEHPAYGLFALVEDKVAGVCGGCADVFGATAAATAAGAKLVRDADVPGTSGVIDLSRYLDDGYRLLTS